MKLVRGSFLVLAALASLTVSALVGCSSDDGNPAAPPGKELNSGDIPASGGIFEHTFSSTIATVTSFPYHCERHPSMNGTVTVDPASSNVTASVSITGITDFTPVTVGPGAKVTWTNNDGALHTVTSD